MARNSDERKKLLEALREAPFISHACKKIGIARATLYRWRENPAFEKEVQDALEMGRARGCDIAEAALFKQMQDGNMTAVKFFLQNNESRYALKRPIYVSPHHTLQPGETCPVCSHAVPAPLSEEEKKDLDRMIKNFKKETEKRAS